MSDNAIPNPGEGTSADITELLNADEVGRTVARIAHQIIDATNADSELQMTCIAVLRPAAWCPSSSSIFSVLPSFVTLEPMR